MKYLAAAGALLLATFAFSISFAPNHAAPPAAVSLCCGCDVVDIARDVIAPYVQIGNEETGIGSGTVISHHGSLCVLTCDHVAEHFEDAPLYKLTPYRRQVWSGALVRRSMKKTSAVDLALYRVRNPDGLVAATIASEAPRPGDDVLYIGTALGVHASLERSIYSGEHLSNGRVLYRSNGNATYGASGGGVFVRGKLVGVMIELYDGDEPRSPILCESLPRIREFLASISEEDVNGSR